MNAAVLVAAAVLATGWPARRRGIALRQPGRNRRRPDVPGAGLQRHLHGEHELSRRLPDEQAIADFLTQNRDGFVNVAQTSASRDVPYQMDVTSEQYQSGQPPRTRSVVLKVFEDLGGPRPSTFYKAFNYDLPRRQPVTFDTLFASGTKPLDAIYPIVQRELGRQTGLGGAVLPGTGRDASHYQNFAITDDDVIFYFAPGNCCPPRPAPAKCEWRAKIFRR
ncbi:immunogenic protein MPT64 [Mycobacterium xenopi 3993]|nr:immunogenic protein MPT64 [Mycobacterium xenopi 3993]